MALAGRSRLSSPNDSARKARPPRTYARSAEWRPPVRSPGLDGRDNERVGDMVGEVERCIKESTGGKAEVGPAWVEGVS